MKLLSLNSTIKNGRFTTFILMMIAALALVGCASNQPATLATNSALETDYANEDYLIGVGDQLAVSVWRNPDLSVTVPVRPDGKISVPLAGDLTAAGETPTALSTAISDKLTNFLKGPQVTVIVTNPASADFQRRVRITGAVGNPLSLPFREGMTVLDLVLLAGGTNDFASPRSTTLYRKSSSGIESYRIDLDKLLNKGDLSQNFTLQPSDVLSVPERLF